MSRRARTRDEVVPVPPAAQKILAGLPRTKGRIFPYRGASVSATFQRAAKFLQLDDITSITSIPLAREPGSYDQEDEEDEDEWEGGEAGINAELVPPNGGTVSLLKDVNTVATRDGRLLEVTSSGEMIRR